MSEIIDINKDNWDSEVVGSKIPVLIDFWAEWCGPCKVMHPILDEMAVELNGKVKITKINIDENMELAQEHGVRAIPTLMIIKDGEVVDQMVGAANRSILLGKLNPFIEMEETAE